MTKKKTASKKIAKKTPTKKQLYKQIEQVILRDRAEIEEDKRDLVREGAQILVEGDNLDYVALSAWANSEHHGFHPVSTLFEKLALIITEITEAMEVERESSGVLTLAQKARIGEELADGILRIGDVATEIGIPLSAVVTLKHNYNLTRPYMHGKNK